MRAGNYPMGKPNMFPCLQIVFPNRADPENERAKLRIAEYRAKSRQLFEGGHAIDKLPVALLRGSFSGEL